MANNNNRSKQRSQSQQQQKPQEPAVAPPEVVEGQEPIEEVVDVPGSAQTIPEPGLVEPGGTDGGNPPVVEGDPTTDDGPEEPEEVVVQERPLGAPLEGLILKQSEPIRFNGDRVGNMVVLTEDIYREVYPFRSKRPTYVLLYSKGATIPLNTLVATQKAQVVTEPAASIIE